MYDLELFGKTICKIRNNLGYTQKYVSGLTTINIETMRKIENGKVTPTQITLELLSPVLKEDLNQLLLNYRLINYANFNDIKTKIELKIESGHYKHLQEELNILNRMLDYENPNTFACKLIKQLSLLVEAVIIKINYKDYNQSIVKLIEAIKVTTPEFDLSKYDKYLYNSMEIRIVMNIALLLNQIESKEKCLEILLFCLSSLNSDEIDFKIKILYNLAYTYHRLDVHEKALYYANEGIETCISNNNLSCLALLYSRKGIAEYHLNNENYKKTLLKAFTLFDITEQHNLKDMLMKFCERNSIDI